MSWHGYEHVNARFGYEAYQLYLGIKLHYNSDYDFNKYNGKVSASFESFLKRSDKFQFSKLRKQHGEQLKDYYVANFMYKDYWVGDLLGEEAKENYTEWKNRTSLYSTVLKKISAIFIHLKQNWTIYLILVILVTLSLFQMFYPSPYHLEQQYYLTPLLDGVPA